MKIIVLVFCIAIFYFPANSLAQFNPTQINNIVFWYSADSVAVSGNSVSILYDRSGNGFNAEQTNNARQPTLVNGLNDLPSLYFDGNDNLGINFYQNFDSSNTIFIICNDLATSGHQYFYGGFSGNDGYSLYHRSNDMMTVQSGTSLPQIYGKTIPFDYSYFTILYGNSNVIIRENGVEKGQANVNQGTFQGIRIGSQSNSTNYTTGNISEIIAYNRILDSTEIANVENYLRYKYAPPINLGSDFTRYSICDTILKPSKWYSSYLWSDSSTTDSLIVTQSGQYWCEAVDVFGNVSRDTINVQVPFIHQPALPTYCPGDSITWKTNVGNSYTYLWSDGSTKDSLSISSPGDYYVTVTDTNGCFKHSDTLHFTEDTFHAAISLGADTSFCQGNAIALQSGAAQAVSYLWNTGETTPSILPQTTGDYSVVALNSNGCSAKDTMHVDILGVAPTVDFSIPLSTCDSIMTVFTDNSFTTDGSTISNRQWTFGDGGIDSVSQGAHTYDSTGFFPVKLIVTSSNGCQNMLSKTVLVNPSPRVNFTTQFSCEKQAINFSGTQQTPQFITNWKWDFGDLNSGASNLGNGQNAGHTFSTYGNFSVQLIGIDGNGCADTATNIKIIKPAPKPNFTYTEVCSGGTVHFTNTSTIPSPNTIQSYNWDFGNGLGSQFTNPQALYNFAGNYNVKLTTTGSNGCINDTTISIRIHDLPIVNHSIINDCALLNSSLVDSSTVIDGTISQVSWQINGGTAVSGKTVNYTFPNPGLFEVKQQVTSTFGCQQTNTYYVNVHDALQAQFNISPDALIAGYPIKFINNSVGANQYQWQFGNYAYAQSKDTTFSFPDSWIDSTIYIQLISSNSFGCKDTTHTSLVVQGRSTDLALTKILYQDFDGYLKMGVRLKNNGSTPISSVDLKVEKTGMGIFKEQWNGLLLGGDSTVYVFSALPLNVVADKDSSKNYICVSGTIVQPSQFLEITLDNNQLCESLSQTEAIIVQPYPNPVGDDLTINVVVPKDIEGKIQIVDAGGKLVYSTEERPFYQGLNKLNVSTANWAKGSYRIWWRGETKLKTVAFVKG